jgi:hypothetical protein
MVMKMKRLSLRFLAAVLTIYCLNGCYLLDKIAEILDSVKNSRPISFLIFEPFAYTADQDGKTGAITGFNDETQGLEDTYKKGIAQAAGDRPWTPIWYSDRDYMLKFYNAFLVADPEKYRDSCHDYLTTLRSSGTSASNCEVLIYTFVITRPADTDNYEVVALAYDLNENSFCRIKRLISKDQGSRKFQEDMGHLVLDLCEKLYGKQ